MNIEEQLKQNIQVAFQKIYDFEIKEKEINFSETKKELEGTHTFITFPYTKTLKQKPDNIAESLGDWLKQNTNVIEDFNVVKGFLNLSISDEIWIKYFLNIYEDEHFGELPPKDEKILVEFSSPNTNKPLHLGHLRTNFLGDAVSRILEANGYEVIKANLVNDRGIHICKSMLAYQKFGQGETPHTIGLKGDHFAGKYYVLFGEEHKKEIAALEKKGIPKAQAEKEAPLFKETQVMLQKWENNDEKVMDLWRQMNDWVYDGFNKTYKDLGIKFDKFYYESQTYLLGKEIIEEGLEKGLFFKKEDNSVWVDLDDEKLDKKLLLRGDGTSVYMTQDLGTADLKYRDFQIDRSIYVVGNEQNHHFKVLFTILKKLGRSYAKGLYHLSYGMVELPKGQGKIKSREGTRVDADDLLAQVINEVKLKTAELGKIEELNQEETEQLYSTLALGALKYFLLKIDPKKRIIYIPEDSVQLQGDTGPFIQYTYARISALLRRALEDKMIIELENYQESLEGSELKLIYFLSHYPAKLEEAGESYSPSVLASYLFELAKTYNHFYANCPIFQNAKSEVTIFRLALSQKTSEVVAQGMELLGIGVPERM